MPGNLVYSVFIQRTAGLTNSADPFSLTGLTNVTAINGNSYTSVYNPTNRTITLVTPVGRSVTNLIDALGRITGQRLAGAPVTDIGYDAFGRLAVITNTSSIGAANTTFSYNGLGQLSAITDPLGRAIDFGYDAAGRPNQEVMPDGSVATLAYDSEYNLTSVTPPGWPAHTFQYNAVASLTKYTPPLWVRMSLSAMPMTPNATLHRYIFPMVRSPTFNMGWRVGFNKRCSARGLRWLSNTARTLVRAISNRWLSPAARVTQFSMATQAQS